MYHRIVYHLLAGLTRICRRIARACTGPLMEHGVRAGLLVDIDHENGGRVCRRR